MQILRNNSQKKTSESHTVGNSGTDSNSHDMVDCMLQVHARSHILIKERITVQSVLHIQSSKPLY